MLMKELNEIWRDKFGRDLTIEEAWRMVDFVNLILENADRNIDEILAQEGGVRNETYDI